jgi:hypothetical protein
MHADYDARALLGVLIDHNPAHLSIEELQRVLDFDAIRITDALADLVRDGLAQRQGEFAFASRAAARFYELGV